MQYLGHLTEWLADLHVKAVLIAVGALLVALTFFRTSRSKDQTSVWLMENVQVILSVVVVVFLIIRPFLFQAFYIPSSSMEPTLMGPPEAGMDASGRERTGDRLLVDKLCYRLGDPKRFDIAVFRAPKRASFEEKEFIKRVMGLPGDTVEIAPPRLVVDGKPALVLASEGISTSLSLADRNDPKIDPSGRTAVLEPRFGPSVIKVIAEPKPDVRWDPYRLEVDGKEELRDATGQIQQREGLGDFAGDPSLKAQVFSVSGDPRVVVITGGKVAYEKGHVVINGKPLWNETYIKEAPRYAMPAVKLGPHEYFMMGDNRNNSNDSHAWGPLTRDRFIGRAEILFWPLNRSRIFNFWLILVMLGVVIAYQVVHKLVSRGG